MTPGWKNIGSIHPQSFLGQQTYPTEGAQFIVSSQLHPRIQPKKRTQVLETDILVHRSRPSFQVSLGGRIASLIILHPVRSREYSEVIDHRGSQIGYKSVLPSCGHLPPNTNAPIQVIRSLKNNPCEVKIRAPLETFFLDGVGQTC